MPHGGLDCCKAHKQIISICKLHIDEFRIAR